jgi:hypothetical protein
MRYRIYCGLTEWFVIVEAVSEQEALEKGKAEFIQRFNESDTYFVRPAALRESPDS